jgi:demethylmenaquinone methyltransferase/2-methoxy-6-polyprenyl-1,4-benzoquinol methylase
MRSDETRTVSSAGPDRELARRKYVRLAPGFEAGLIRRVTVGRTFEHLRRRAIDRLSPRPGETILDVGCGTGASFPFLLERVGPEGRVIGIDQSADMLEHAQQRLDREGWSNVTLLNAPAEEASIGEPVQHALIFLSHDLVRNEAALSNIVATVEPAGRIVAAGMRRASGLAAPLSYIAWRAARRYITTFEDRERPWSLLQPKLDGFAVDLHVLRLGYVASGSVPREEGGASSPGS